MTRPSRISRGRIVERLRLAARKGDQGALTLALDEMRTLAMSPRYWERYLELLEQPLARLVDLLVIKQGERIARQKGWPRPKRRRRARSPAPPAPAAAVAARRGRKRSRPPLAEQPSLF